LEGTCRLYVGGEVATATQAAFVSIPRGVTHGFMLVGGGARALVMFTPAAMEGFWEEIGAAVDAGTLDPTKPNCCDVPIMCSRSDHSPLIRWPHEDHEGGQ
jgi:hypothetical protein